jgi:hypothetical protein
MNALGGLFTLSGLFEDAVVVVDGGRRSGRGVRVGGRPGLGGIIWYGIKGPKFNG